MRLYMKQAVFSLKDRFWVFNDTGDKVYQAEGEFFTLGSRLRILNTQEVELAYIRQKLISLMPRYQIYIEGESRAELAQKVLPLSNDYYITGHDWELKGDLPQFHFTITDKQDNLIMSHEKKWCTSGDSYEMIIPEEKNVLLCVCIAVAIDNVLTCGLGKGCPLEVGG